MTSRFAMSGFSRLLPAVVLAVFFLPHFTFAQGSSPSERTYQKSESAVDKALQQVHSSIGGRLPVLDGFVDTDQSLDSYSRGYYQCSVQVTPASSGGTLVRVTAKITAWYAGSGTTQGGYRVLHSNGRLEADFLDRLDDALGGTASAQNSPAAPSSASPTETASSETMPSEAAPANAAPTSPSAAAPEPTAANPSSSKPAMVGSVPAASLPPGVVLPPYNPATSKSSSSTSEDLMSPRQLREEAQQQKDLIADIQGLEEIQRNQIHPTNLAVVKHAGTPVLSKPASSAPAIFQADAGDEFEILGNQGSWIHVRIAGQSLGWIRRIGLDLPGGAESSKSTEDRNRSETSAFHISREETKPFPGQWEPLHGKMVRIIWVEPSAGSATSSARVKRSFAKSAFSKAYQETASATQPIAGVVIVFDSADGGQISATLATLKEWKSGSLSEASFWKRCALDPPDFLQESSEAAGDNR